MYNQQYPPQPPPRRKFPWLIVIVLIVIIVIFLVKLSGGFSSSPSGISQITSTFGMKPIYLITGAVLCFIIYYFFMKGKGPNTGKYTKNIIAVIIFIIFMSWLINRS